MEEDRDASSCDVQDAATRVLVLGDGDLSFSHSLVRRLEAEKLTGDRRASVMCTSYDTREEVLRRYPASRSILASLLESPGGDGGEAGSSSSSRKRKRAGKRKRTSVSVLHRVNAAAIGETLAGFGRGHPGFDLLWFNFPHSGAEDRPRHRALLRHFFASAASLLRGGEGGRVGEVGGGGAAAAGGEGIAGGDAAAATAAATAAAAAAATAAAADGSATAAATAATFATATPTPRSPRQRQRAVVHLALAGKQPERWDCLGAATAAGFELLAVLPFCDDAFPGYVRRRNTKGKSFRRTRPGDGPVVAAAKSELGARTFLFALRDEEAAQLSKEEQRDPSLLPPPMDVGALAETLKSARVPPSVASVLVASVLPAPGRAAARGKAAKEKSRPAATTSYPCPLVGCSKAYSSARGLKTHMMQFHRPRSDLVVACADQTGATGLEATQSEIRTFACAG